MVRDKLKNAYGRGRAAVGKANQQLGEGISDEARLKAHTMHNWIGLISLLGGGALIMLHVLFNPQDFQQGAFYLSLLLIAAWFPVRERVKATHGEMHTRIRQFHAAAMFIYVGFGGLIWFLNPNMWSSWTYVFANSGAVLYGLFFLHEHFANARQYMIKNKWKMATLAIEIPLILSFIWFVPWQTMPDGRLKTAGQTVKDMEDPFVNAAETCVYGESDPSQFSYFDVSNIGQNLDQCREAIQAALDQIIDVLKLLPFYPALEAASSILIDLMLNNPAIAALQCGLEGGGLFGQINEGAGADSLADCAAQRSGTGGSGSGLDWERLQVSGTNAVLGFNDTIDQGSVESEDFDISAGLSVTRIDTIGTRITLVLSGTDKLQPGDSVKITVRNIASSSGEISTGSCTVGYGSSTSTCKP